MQRTISQISLRACSIDIPRSCSFCLDQNLATEGGHISIQHSFLNSTPLDLLQALASSFPDTPLLPPPHGPPPRFEPPPFSLPCDRRIGYQSEARPEPPISHLTPHAPQSIGKPKQSQLAIIIPSHCENKSNTHYHYRRCAYRHLPLETCPLTPSSIPRAYVSKVSIPFLGALSCHQTYHRQAAREFAPVRIFSLVGPQTCIFGFLFLSLSLFSLPSPVCVLDKIIGIKARRSDAQHRA
jgi:hypothetical protein